jgi:hypothetical protein
VLEKSSDGFYLANMDLLLRGPGDLLGKKQSGHLPEFPIARLEIDGNILQEAHAAALVRHFSEVFSFKFFLLELSIFIQNKSYISSYSYELVIFGLLITSVSSINCLC